MTIRMIWAQSRGGVIGKDGAIPWHLPEDLARFRELTMGSVCVMGRRTWESLPEAFRPLPGRVNVVLTSRAAALEGASTFASVADVLSSYQDFWVIGGAAVYRAFAPLASEVHVTEVDLDVPGDVWAPELPEGFVRTSSEARTSRDGVPYAFTTWERREVASAS